MIDELSNEYTEKAVIGKLDVDQHPEIAEKYGIMSIPSILFFLNGEVVDKIKGAVPKKEIALKLEKILTN